MNPKRMIRRMLVVVGAVCLAAASSHAQNARAGVDGPVRTKAEAQAMLQTLQAMGRPFVADPERGTVNREWTDAQLDGVVYRYAEFDAEGNLILIGQDNSGVPVVTNLSIAPNTAPVENWTVHIAFMAQDPLFFPNETLAVGLDGFVYVGGRTAGSEASALVKIHPQGFIQWQREYLGTPRVSQVLVSQDGIPFIAMGSTNPIIAQVDPFTGALAWTRETDDVHNAFSTIQGLRMALDPGGVLWVVGQQAGTDISGFSSVLFRLDTTTGDTIPMLDASEQLVDYQALDVRFFSRENCFENGCNGLGLVDIRPIAIDSDGSVVIVGSVSGTPQLGVVRKFDQDGTPEWTRTRTRGNQNGHFDFVEIGKEGDIFAGGRTTLNGSFNEGPLIVRLDASGSVIWTREVAEGHGESNYDADFTVDRITGFGLDRLENVYYTSINYSDTFDQLQQTFKVANANGSTAWFDNEGLPSGYRTIFPLELAVDGGANVVVVTFEETQSSEDGRRIIKYSQDFVGIPTIQTATANLTFEDQGIWAPGVGVLEEQLEFFRFPWNFGIDVGDSVDTVVAGEYGAGFEFRTDGELGVGVRAEIDGGTVDVHYPLEIEYTIPSPDKLIGGISPVTITSTVSVDPAARMTSCFAPDFNAGLIAEVEYDVYADAFLSAAVPIFDEVFVDEDDFIPYDYIPGIDAFDIPGPNVKSILGALGVPDLSVMNNFNFGKGLLTGSLRSPQLVAQAAYDAQSGRFDTSATDRFMLVNLSVTELILRFFAATAQFDFYYGNAEGSAGIEGEGQAFQLFANLDIAANQDLQVIPSQDVRYDFFPSVEFPPDSGSFVSTVTLPAGDPLSFTLPMDGQVEIVPTVLAKGAFTNETGIEMIPGIEWITLEYGAAAFAFGFDLITVGPTCLLCFDWDLAEILAALQVGDPEIVNLEFNLFPGPGGIFDNMWDIPFPAQTLPCIRIVGDGEQNPRLIGGSRATVPMIIYDQTSPSVSSFNVSIADSTKLLLYGERFCDQPGGPGDPCNGTQAYIEHYGQIEMLPTTPINASTCLVELPNRFRLLPGVAKLWVESNLDGTPRLSETIDLAIEYPVPRLDAVNPNLWAADPDLAVLPVSVIDAKSFAGNDTFIARRDYWIKMRDELWTSNVAGGVSAETYFPLFDFNQMPEFPAVLWGDPQGGPAKPLARFVQPVDNGIHNVRLAQSNYDRPAAVPVRLCNPGPGGGMSRELILTIAAPQPVVATFDPNGISPLDILESETDDMGVPLGAPVQQPFTLTVTGPRHVPTFNGYEEPKYGNFNADSVVRIDGVDLPTTFVSSSRLLAEIDPSVHASLIALGDHELTVFTPTNGTKYFEELRVDATGGFNDANGNGIQDPGELTFMDFNGNGVQDSGEPDLPDGEPDDVPVFQGLVDSGGSSVPHIFRVEYRTPTIEGITPSQVRTSVAVFDDSTYAMGEAPAYNMTVLGADFRDGAEVLINGQPRDTQYCGSTMLKAKLLPQDGATAGNFEITVRNPGPDFKQSEPSILEVVDLPAPTVFSIKHNEELPFGRGK